MAALHGKAVAALFEIIKAMGLSFVPYLPKVWGPCCTLLALVSLVACPTWPTWLMWGRQ